MVDQKTIHVGALWLFARCPSPLWPLPASGDRVVVPGRYAGTNKATGKALDAQFAHVLTVTDGRIVGFQQYTDTARWLDVVTPD